VLDLAGLRFFGAAGVTALLQIREVARAHATHLILRDLSPITCFVLTVTAAIDAFEIKTGGPDR
jgi:anti-anti-sigma regulatory factor